MNKKNKTGGFLKFIIVIIIAVFLMSYFNVSIRGFFDWFISAIRSIF